LPDQNVRPTSIIKSFFHRIFGKKRAHLTGGPAGADCQGGPRREEAEPYRPGDLIGGKYEIRRTIGRGGFGVVYLAFNRETTRVCALKTFRDELIADPAARETFKREADVWIGLEDHPFILAARWVNEFSGRLFVEMDYVAPDDKGRVSLGDHLAAACGPLNTNQVVKWSIQFCLGMEHANACGVACHRDIKPANIIIAGDEAVKIADFGLATAAQAMWGERDGEGGFVAVANGYVPFGVSLMRTHGVKICGTPGYIPPEVLRGQAWDRRGDVYSFGLVLWQMMAGSTSPPCYGLECQARGVFFTSSFVSSL
jgi:serine/threonine protein kinase